MQISPVRLLFFEIAAVIFYMTAWYVVARTVRKNDVADIAWGPGFIVAALVAAASTDTLTPRALLVMSLTGIWGTRLALHISLRNRGRPEDARYRTWREEWGRHAEVRAFFQIFMFQGFLLLIAAVPVIFIIISEYSPPGLLDACGTMLWLTGFLFEAIADWQLGRFKRNPQNRGKIMRYGVWKYSRHPNYFGEVTLWWGLYFIALSVPMGWTSIIGPLLITLLILKVSGIPMLEKKYEGNPEFEAYRRITSAFLPLPPRKE